MITAEEAVQRDSDATVRPRLRGLDVIRGTYIVLAIWQHFSGYLTERDLPVDSVCYFLHRYLTPSGDQIFLALAAFNLASREQQEFISHYASKIRVFHLLFWFFFFENIAVSNNLGDGLSWGPMLTWMVLLSLLATIYRFFGVRGVVGCFAAHLFIFLLPMQHWNDQLEEWLRAVLQLPYFVYESRLDLFFGSACMGFLCGYLYHHGAHEMRLPRLLTVGALLCLPFLLFGELPHLDPAHVWATEYAVTHTPIGLLSIWGTILIMISGVLILEQRGYMPRIPIISWCGEHSLLVFAIHRVLFVRVILPVTLQVFLLAGWTLHNSIWMLLVYTACVLGIAWIMLRSRLLLLLSR